MSVTEPGAGANVGLRERASCPQHYHFMPIALVPLKTKRIKLEKRERDVIPIFYDILGYYPRCVRTEK